MKPRHTKTSPENLQPLQTKEAPDPSALTRRQSRARKTALEEDALSERPGEQALGEVSPDAMSGLGDEAAGGHGASDALGAPHSAAAGGVADSPVEVAATGLDHRLGSSTAVAPDVLNGLWPGLPLAALGAVALGAAASAGFGSSGAAGSPAAASGTTVSGLVVLGPVLAGHQLAVQLYRADGTVLGDPVAVRPDGTFTVPIADYSGVIKARLLDSDPGDDFRDEATGRETDLSAEVWAVGFVAVGAATSININPLTTLAYRALGANPTRAQVNEAMDAVAKAFGLSAETLASTPPIAVNSAAWAAADKSSPAARYGLALAVFSGMDAINGGNMQQSLDDASGGLVDGGGSFTSEAMAQLLAGAARAQDAVSGIDLVGAMVSVLAPEATSAAAGLTVDVGTRVTDIAVPVVAQLSEGQLAALDAGQVGQFTAAQLAVLTGQRIRALGTDLTGLSAEQVATLSDEQFRALTVSQKHALFAAGDLAGLSAAQLALLTFVPPAFTSGTTASVAENTAGTVYTAAATADVTGASIAYSLTGADAELFDINASTGEVTFKAAPNFEAPTDAGANNVYDIIVTATEAGNANTSTRAVAITVTDVSDVNEAPVVTNDGVTVGNMVAGAATSVAVTGMYAKGSATNLLSGQLLYTTSAYRLGVFNSFLGEMVGGGYNYVGSPNWLSTNLVNTGKINNLSQLDGGLIEFADGKKGVIYIARDGGGAESSFIYYQAFDAGLNRSKTTFLATESRSLILTSAQLLANDTDDFVGAMTISAVTAQVLDANSNVVGTATLSSGNIVFTPDAYLVSAMDIYDVRNATINYTVRDATGLTSQAIVTINIMGTNNAPTVVNDGGALGNSMRGALTGATVTGLYSKGSSANLMSGKPALTTYSDYAQFGEGNFGNGGAVRDGYNYVGASNWFVANGVSLSSIVGGVIEFANGTKGIIKSASNGTVGDDDSWIYYRAYNSGVIAGRVYFETTENQSLIIGGPEVLANDFDRHGPVSIASVTPFVLDGDSNVVGTAVINSRGDIVFTPDRSLDSMDWGDVRNATINYKIKDALYAESNASVTINILGESNAQQGAILMNTQAAGAASGVTVTGLYARGSTTNLMVGKSQAITSDNYQQATISLGEGAALFAGGNLLNRSGWFVANGFYDLSVFEGGLIEFSNGSKGILHSVSDGPTGSLSKVNYSICTGLDTSQRYFVGNTQTPFFITASELVTNDADEIPSRSLSAIDTAVTDDQGRTVATAVLNDGMIQVIPLANLPMAPGAVDYWRLNYVVHDNSGQISARYANLNVLQTHDFVSVSSKNGISVQAMGQQLTRFNIVVDGNSIYTGSPSSTGSLAYWINNFGDFRANADYVTTVALGSQTWTNIANNISDVDRTYKSNYMNIIFVGEGNNSFYNEAVTIEGVWQSAVNYVRAVKYNNPDWIVILALNTPANEPGMTPQQNEFYNQRLLAWNNLAKTHYLNAGFDYFVDYAYAGSPFERYDLNSFNQYINIWGDRWVHPNSNGKAIMASNLIQPLSKIDSSNHYSISFDFASDPGTTFNWDGVNGDVEVFGGKLSVLSGSGNSRTAVFTPSAAAVLGLETPYVRVKPLSYSTATGLNPVEELLYLDVVAPVAKTLTAAARTYVAGDWFDVSIRFSEDMVLGGASNLRLLIGNVEKTAIFSSYDANGRTAVFRYQIESGLSDSDGVTVVSATNVSDQFNNSWVFSNLQLNSDAVIQA